MGRAKGEIRRSERELTQAKHQARAIVLRCVAPALACVALAPAALVGQQPAFDLSGVDAFWRVADAHADGGPVDAAVWDRLFEHPGYAQLDRQAQRRRILERCVPLVFAPGREAELEEVTAQTRSLAGRVCAHLQGVRDARDEVEAFASRIEVASTYRRAVGHTAEYLPAGTTDEPPSPAVRVMLFEANGFGGPSILLDLFDLMQRSDEAIVALIGHELHHAYRGRLPEPLREWREHGWLLGPLSRMQSEGIASLIDKRSWLLAESRADPSLPESRREAMAQFTELVATARDRLEILDRLVPAVADGTTTSDEADGRTQAIIPFGGHATGMYMALAIEDAFGRDSIRALNRDPALFLLRYQDAARVLGDRFVFSDATVAFVRRIRSTLLVPETGVDVSAVDHFFRLVDTLSAAVGHTEGQWAAMLRTAGGDQARRLRHLTRAATLREELLALADRLEESSPLDQALEQASPSLPAGVTEGRMPPLVALGRAAVTRTS